jgi:hypothetical protein
MRPGVVLVAVALAVAQFDRREQGMKRRIMELSRWRQKQKFKLEMGGMNAWPWTRTMHSILTIAKLWAREALGLVGFKRIEIL